MITRTLRMQIALSLDFGGFLYRPKEKHMVNMGFVYCTDRGCTMPCFVTGDGNSSSRLSFPGSLLIWVCAMDCFSQNFVEKERACFYLYYK